MKNKTEGSFDWDHHRSIIYVSHVFQLFEHREPCVLLLFEWLSEYVWNVQQNFVRSWSTTSSTFLPTFSSSQVSCSVEEISMVSEVSDAVSPISTFLQDFEEAKSMNLYTLRLHFRPSRQKCLLMNCLSMNHSLCSFLNKQSFNGW